MKTTVRKSLKSLLPIVAMLAGSAALMQCSTTQPEPVAVKLVSPPFRAVDVPGTALSFNAEEGANFSMPNGTRISVPPGVIVDASGKEVKGKVDLTYREFHNATDILASGITMKYKEGGLDGHLQTAGMMEINAWQKDKPVFIAEGKQIQIAMASFAPAENMNLYYLDPEKGWVQEGQPVEQANDQKTELPENNTRQTPKPPVQPEKIKKGEFVFGFIPNYDQFPELKSFKGIEWKYAGTDSSTNPEKNRAAFKKVWSDVKLEPLNAELQTYALLLTTPTDTFRSVVKPAFRGKNYDKAMADFNKRNAEYEASLAERKAAEKAAVVQADVLYNFAFTRFGVWNCDRFYNMPEAVTAEDAKLLIDGKAQTVVTVFHITGNGRVVIQFPGYNGMKDLEQFRFTFSPTEDNKLLAVLPDNHVAIMDQSDFNKLDMVGLRTTGKCELALETVPQQVNSMEDLDRIIAGN